MFKLNFCSSQSKDIRIDDLGATVPYLLKSCNLQSTKNYTSFGLVNLISEHFE